MVIKTLFVDDDIRFLELVKEFMIDLNPKLDISICNTPQKALNQISSGSYDVLISDYQMPEMDGLELLAKIRKQGNRMPFIMFTGHGREEVAMKAINLGVTSYVMKDVDVVSQFAELNHMIEFAYKSYITETKLEASEKRYRTLVESAPYGIVVHRDGILEYANPQALSSLGYSAFESLRSKNLSELVTRQPHDDELVDIFSDCEEGGSLSTEHWILWDCREIDVELSQMEVDFENDSAKLMMFNDISSKRASEQLLRKNERKYREILDALPIGVEIIGGNPPKVFFASEGFQRIIGYSQEELQSMHYDNLIRIAHEEDRERITSYIEKRLRGEIAPSRYRIRVFKKNKELVYADILAKSIEFEGQRLSLLTFEDVTSEVNLESALSESEDRYQSIFEMIPWGFHICKLDEEDNLILIDTNPAGEKMTGILKNDHAGMKYAELFPRAKESGILAEYVNTARNGEPFYTPAFKYYDARMKPSYWQVQTIGLPNHGLCIAFQDVSEFVKDSLK